MTFSESLPARRAARASRIQRACWWIGAVLYVLIALFGALLFAHYVHDQEWRIQFLTVWWLPAGAVALWLKNRIEHWFFSLIDDDSSN
jgi:hypothetical protein